MVTKKYSMRRHMAGTMGIVWTNMPIHLAPQSIDTIFTLQTIWKFIPNELKKKQVKTIECRKNLFAQFGYTLHYDACGERHYSYTSSV